MNPMLTRFPESVRIDGVRYPLNTDFRVGLRIMSAYEDPQLTRFERQVVLCRLLYQEQPSDFTQAVQHYVAHAAPGSIQVALVCLQNLVTGGDQRHGHGLQRGVVLSMELQQRHL